MPKLVLVVEEQRHIARLCQVTLERQGYQVVTAANRWEAVERARARQPDMIALDEATLEGAAAREALSECPETRSLPIFQIPPGPW